VHFLETKVLQLFGWHYGLMKHANPMKAIRNMEPAWEKVNGLKFQLVEYRDQKGELRPCY